MARIFNDDFYDKVRLGAAEDAGPFNISRQGVPNVFLVLRPSPSDRDDEKVDLKTQRLGCLPFVMPHYLSEGLTARVSEMVPCRSSLDTDRQWPPN